MELVAAFLLKYRKPIVYFLLIVVASGLFLYGIGTVRTYFSNRQVAKLEQQIRDSELKIQQLEGEKRVNEQTIKTITGLLEQSNQNLIEAQAQTDKVRTVYVSTKAKGPTFVNTTDEGRVKELSDELNKLYP